MYRDFRNAFILITSQFLGSFEKVVEVIDALIHQ